MLDRHDVLAEAEFFPLNKVQAKRDELATLRGKLRDLGYSEDAVTRTLGIEGPYLLTRIGRKLWPRYVIPGSDPDLSADPSVPALAA